jgi:hypothetical protein
MALAPGERVPAFMRANLRPGVEPPSPPPGPTPLWMAKRPAGLSAIVAAFKAGELDIGVLRRFECPRLLRLRRP